MAQVALVRYMVQGHDTPVQVNGKNYVFMVRRGISFCMVDEEDVPAILSLHKICCGGRRRKLFKHASQSQIDVWNT